MAIFGDVGGTQWSRWDLLTTLYKWGKVGVHGGGATAARGGPAVERILEREREVLERERCLETSS